MSSLGESIAGGEASSLGESIVDEEAPSLGESIVAGEEVRGGLAWVHC